MKKNKLYEMLLDITQIPEIELNEIIKKSSKSYIIFQIKKKNGKTRKVFKPTIETMLLQECLMNCSFQNFKINENCFSYVKGLKSPLYKNALKHKNYKYTLHLDFKHFFESISPENFFQAIEYSFGYIYSDLDKSYIKNICFYNKNNNSHLVIGAPSSPIISNIYMKNFDDYFSIYADQNSDSYSRYADDLYFSTNDYDNLNSFKKNISRILKGFSFYSNLKINNEKTKIFQKQHSKQITGLVINNKDEIKVPQKKKKELKHLLYLVCNEKNIEKNLQNKEFEDKENIILQKIQGYLSFINDNEKNYIESLKIKYPNYFRNYYKEKPHKKVSELET